jgi:hypothetical protein
MVPWWHHSPKISSSSQTKKPRGSSLAYSMEGNHHPASSRIMPETKTGQPTWDATSILICPSAGHSRRMCECSSGAEWRKEGSHPVGSGKPGDSRAAGRPLSLFRSVRSPPMFAIELWGRWGDGAPPDRPLCRELSASVDKKSRS